VNNTTARLLASSISRCSLFTNLDVIILLLLYSRPRERTAVLRVLLNASWKGALDLQTLIDVIDQTSTFSLPSLAGQFTAPLLAFASALLRSKHQEHHEWAEPVFMELFDKHACRMEVIGALVGASMHDLSDILASRVLASLAEARPMLLAPFSHLLEVCFVLFYL